jgi:putative acetyltransferase
MEVMSEVIIKEYEPAFAGAYKQLNLEWIEQYFVVEQHDREQLDNPDEYIISKGGYILFALYDKEVVGTCALIRTGECEFEMAKMAVSPRFQGKKIGRLLGEAILEKSRSLGAERVWLESNRVLETAVNLYRKLGFREIPMGDTLYARADIKMEKWLVND